MTQGTTVAAEEPAMPGGARPAAARRVWTARLVPAGRVLAAVALLAGCGGDEEPEAEAAPEYVSVGRENVAVVASEQIQTGPVISGTLTAQNSATVRAESGGTVIQVFAEQGQPVGRGAVLARIEGITAEQAYLSAQAALRSAERNLEVAEREAERTSTLVRAGALAERDLENARNGTSAAQAQVAGARAQLAAAAKQVENTVVRAPIAGIVSDRPVNAGDVVAPGAPLFTVVDPGDMRLEASVPSEQLGSIRIGAPVRFTVNGYPGRTFTGRIERINPSADPVTRQVPIFVSIPNSGGSLVAGLFAQGRIAADQRVALVVPVSALDQRGATPRVLRVRGGVTEQVGVRTGITDPETERIEITAGLAAGDTVLTGAATGITASTPIRIGPAPAPAARPAS